MTIHYKNKDNKPMCNIPRSFSMQLTDDWDEVTCKGCTKVRDSIEYKNKRFMTFCSHDSEHKHDRLRQDLRYH